MATEPITHCASCGTHWSDCDVIDGGQCAACLRKQIERLREERDECRKLVESYRQMLTVAVVTAREDTS